MARSFNGTSDQVALPIRPNGFFWLTQGTPFAFGCWFKLPTSATSGSSPFPCIAEAVNNSASVCWSLGIDISTGTSRTLQSIRRTASGFQTCIGATTGLNDGLWHHALCVATATSVQNYLDGATDGTPGGAGNGVAGFNLQDWYMGSGAGGNSYWPGSLADFAWWNTTLTAVEVVGLARGERPNNIRDDNLAVWLPLNGDTSPEADIAGGFARGVLNVASICNGTLTGTAKAFGPPILPITPRGRGYEFFQLYSLLMPQIVT